MKETRGDVDMVVVAGGRQVAVHRLAEGNTGRTLVLCHPAPGAGTFDPDPEQTWARGVTLLAVDRPGYGLSEPLLNAEGATIAAFADDLAVVLDQYRSGPIGVAGWSAGGRVALALAARHPDIVDRVVVLGTPAPHEHVPWIPQELQQVLDILRGLEPEEARTSLSQQLAQLIPSDAGAEGALDLLGVTSADDAALAMPGARERLTHMLETAFAQGAIGLADDIASYCLRSWGFEPQEVKAKTLLLYGSEDPVAGSRHGTWWQKNLPNARLEVVPGAGHLLILPMWHRVLSHLAPGVKRQR